MTRASVLSGLFVLLLALGVRLAYVEEHARELQLDVSRLTQTDNHVFAEWARIIAAGDVLCRQQPHAYHHWTRLVAPEGRWLEWYGGEQTFHQAPLYPYLVAGVFAFIGDEHVWVTRMQALLSALTCLLTFVLATRLAGLRAGLIAGTLLALCGGYVFYDAFILRDGPMAFFVVLVALALDVAVRRDSPLAWLAAGASLGLFSLAKETGPALFAITALLLAWQHRRRPAHLARTGAALALGFALLLAPAAWRNREVGAPLLKLSTRGPEVLVAGNARGQDGVGWDPPIGTLREILTESNFSTSRAFLLTLATHRAAPWGFVELLADKTAALFNDYEVPNNVNYYLHRAHLGSLRWGVVGWGLLTPAAALGLLVGLRRRKRLVVPYLMFGALTASIVLLYVLARFRLQLLPLMAVFAAIGIDGMIAAWRQGRRGATLLGVAFAAAIAFWARAPVELVGVYTDENKNMSLAVQLVKAGNYERALHFYDAHMLTISAETLAKRDVAERLAQLESSIDALRGLDALPMGSAEHHLRLAHSFTHIVPATKRADLAEFARMAREHYAEALRLDPGMVGVSHGLARLEALLATHPTRGGSVGSFGPVIRHLRDELERHPAHAESHRDLGLVYREGERSPERWHLALTHLLTARRLGLEDGELLAAIALLSSAPDMKALPPVRVIDTAEPFHDPARAAAAARRADELEPGNPRVLDDLAVVAYVFEDIDTAVGYLERLGVLQPWRQDVPSRIRSYRQFEANRLATPPTDATEAPPAEEPAEPAPDDAAIEELTEEAPP